MAVITIARQFGAGGRTIGSRVASELNYRFMDDVVIQELARRIKVTQEAVQDIENIAGGFFSKIVSSMLSRSYMERLTGEDFGYIDEVIYVKKLKEVIIDLAKKDNVVLLGRGSSYFLQNNPNTFHFLLVANREDRVAFMRDNYDLSTEKADEMVEQGDRRRRKIYSLIKNYEYSDPLHYHMVLNASFMGLEQIQQQILALVRG